MAAVFAPFLAPFLVCLLGLTLDRLLGEPRRLHPLVGFGTLAGILERKLNQAPKMAWRSLVLGVVALCALVLPLLFLTLWLSSVLNGLWLLLAQAASLYFAISLKGLAEHGLAVAEPLQLGELDAAREQVSRIVSRQASALDGQGVAAAATESMLENGADAVFASLFWFLVGGIPGVIVHRAVNTLDAMWGYRNPQFLYFGRAAARLDDVMGWVPARLTALTYTLLGNRKLAWHCWRQQAPQWDSPNAGPAMAAGAGALNVQLGGPSPYAQGVKQRPYLGATNPASADSIRAAIALVRRGTWLWLAVIFATTGVVAVAAGW
ncbi:MAG: adenosylcobinamide-phosphate synthase CbiB [Marinobacter sp.]